MYTKKYLCFLISIPTSVAFFRVIIKQIENKYMKLDRSKVEFKCIFLFIYLEYYN